MRDGSEIEALLDSLETLADEAEGKRKEEVERCLERN
jgi:hypothetical protein